MAEKLTSKIAMELEDKYGAHNYHPLAVVLSKGKGAKEKWSDLFGVYKRVTINWRW